MSIIFFIVILQSLAASNPTKIKAFDAKFRLIKERAYIPQIAVGFRDFGGSALFAAEYIVASKLIGNVDFTLGLGFGTISNRNIANPLAKLEPRFESRDRVLHGRYTGWGDQFWKVLWREKRQVCLGEWRFSYPSLRGLD